MNRGSSWHSALAQTLVGLAGGGRGGNTESCCDDPRDAPGQFGIIVANPPFNVIGVDKERFRDADEPGCHFPFGLRPTDNANRPWIQLFHPALNAKGRAGFIMGDYVSGRRIRPKESTATVSGTSMVTLRF